jgi:hypothetical protein
MLISISSKIQRHLPPYTPQNEQEMQRKVALTAQSGIMLPGQKKKSRPFSLSVLRPKHPPKGKRRRKMLGKNRCVAVD